MKNTLSLVLILLLFSSCTRIIMVLYGVKNPDIESEKSIKKCALKYQLDTSNIVTVGTKDFIKQFVQAVPDAAIFDANGEYIEYRKTDTSCNAGLFDFIPELSTQNTYNKTGVTTLQKELNKYRNLKGEPIAAPEKADFYVLIYWTVWSGRLNKDHVKIWEDLAKNNKKSTVKVIKVNVDLQQHWDATERDAIIAKLRKAKK